MRSLQESLFDDNLVQREIGWCIGESFYLGECDTVKARRICAYNPTFDNKKTNWLDCINWRFFKKELAKLNIKYIPGKDKEYLGITKGPEYDSTKTAEQKLLEIAKYILNFRWTEEIIEGSYNSRIRDEVADELDRFLDDPDHFSFSFQTYYHVGRRVIIINLRTISTSPTPFSSWVDVARWEFVSKKGIFEGLFDKDLVENTWALWEPFDEWLNGEDNDPWMCYSDVMRYFLKLNDDKVFPKELRDQAKILRDDYYKATGLYKSTSNKYTYAVNIDAMACAEEVWNDLEINPMEEVWNTFNHRQDLLDGTVKVKKIDKDTLSIINEYLQYYGEKPLCPNCRDYLIQVNDTTIDIIGLPKNTPDYMLKLFKLK